MNATLPTGRAGTALAVGLLGSVLLAGWFGGAAPLLAWRAGQAEALAQRQLLAEGMASFAATLPALQRAVAERSSGTAASVMLKEGTDAIAAAALQGMVRDMAGQAGATLFSVETLPVAAEGSYRRIGLRLSLSASWPVLANLLAAIEQARPRMVVDDLELHQSQLRLGEAEMLLNAAFTLYGFRSDGSPREAP